jgi:hypothetical protein
MKIFSKMLDNWALGQSLKNIPPIFRADIVAAFKYASSNKDHSEKKQGLMDTKKSMENVIISGSEERKAKRIQQYQNEVKTLRKNILAPTLKMAVPTIDYTVRDEKADAKLAIMKKKGDLQSSMDGMKQTLATMPCITQKDKVAVYFLLVFSLVVNFFFFQIILGDFIQGSTNLSIIANLFLALILVVAEVLGPQMLFTAFPDNLAISLARWTTIIGGILIVMGVIILFLGRGEITQAVTPVTNALIK